MKFSRMKVATLSLLLLLGGAFAGANVVTVGPTGQYTSPCVAFSHLADGDTVQVDANNGVPYNEGNCTIKNNNLTIVGVNGRPVLDATGVAISKGTWIEAGHDVVIDNFEFRNASSLSSASNAAGLRIAIGTTTTPAGGNVTVQHCYIHDNNNGILSENVGASYQWYSPNPFILFQYDEFYHNGYGDGYTHNFYIGYGGNMTFTLQYSWSHDSYVGHTVKSRAQYNNILYNLIGDAVGKSSFILNFPDGGSTYVVGNTLYKASTASCSNCNQAMVLWRDKNDAGSTDPLYGLPNEDLHFINNTVVDDPANTFPSWFVTSECFLSSSDSCAAPTYGTALTTPGVFENNIFVGPATQVSNQPSALVQNNLVLANTPANLAALFVDPAHFNYHLLAGSPAIHMGVYPPTDNTGTADPKALAGYEYLHPVAYVARPTPSGSSMDEGAYSYPRVDTPPALTVTANPTSATFPATGTITVSGLPTPPAGQYNFVALVSSNLSEISAIAPAETTTGTAVATFQPLPGTSTVVVPVDVYSNGAHATVNITVNPAPTAIKSITLDKHYYPESTVTLWGPSSTDTVVALTSSNLTTLYAPSSVTIPAGQVSAETGSINGSLWGQSPTYINATLTGSFNGGQASLVIPVWAPNIHNTYPSLCTVPSGAPIPIHLTMAGDFPPSGGSATVSSNNPAVLPTQTFSLPAGNFNNVLNVSTNAVSTNTVLNYTLTTNGSTSTFTSGSGTNCNLTLVPPAANIAVLSGSGQSATVGTNFTNPLVVVVTDANNNLVPGAQVTFAGTGINFTTAATVRTNSSGQAQVTAQPTTTGALTVTASVAGVTTQVSFAETGTSGAAASVATVSGSGQSASVGTNFTNPLVVVVKDASNNPVSGVTVTFAGTGVSFSPAATAVTDSTGQAQVAAQPTAAGALTVTASVAGVATPASFSETGVAVASITLDNRYQPGTTVNLSAAAPAGGVVVQLSSSDPTILYAPATVTVPAGATSAETGTLLGSIWGQSPQTKSATLTATLNGSQATLTNGFYAPTIHAFYCGGSPCPVTGGQQLGVTLSTGFGGAPQGGATVTLTSSNTSAIPNQTYNLTSGQNYATFKLNTNTVTTSTLVSVTANFNGSTATIQVQVN